MAGGSDDAGTDTSTTDSEGTQSGAWPDGLHPAVLDLEYVFEALHHPRRRYLMYALASDAEWTLRDVATKLTAWEQDVDESVVESTRRDQTYVSLYHNHVPKLVDLGVLEFDSETERIARGEHARQVLAALHGVGQSLDDRREQHAERSYDAEDAG